MGVVDYFKRQLKIVIDSQFEEHWSKPHLSNYADLLQHVKQRYCAMLATATGDGENKYYVVTWTFHLESSMYLRRRQWLRQIVVMCHVACWFRSGAVLKFDQFCHSSFF